MGFYKFVLVILLFSISSFANMNDIIENMIKNYGGEQALKKAIKYKQIWKIHALKNNTIGEDNRIVELPNTLITKLSYQHKTEVRYLTPKENYKEFNGERQKAEGIQLQAMRLQLKRLYTPIQLKSIIDTLTLEDYDTHYALVLNKKEARSIYFVDKDTYLITQVTSIIYAGNHKILFNTLYTKFKKFNGVLFPTKEYKSTNNIKTAVLELKDIAIVE